MGKASSLIAWEIHFCNFIVLYNVISEGISQSRLWRVKDISAEIEGVFVSGRLITVFDTLPPFTKREQESLT